MNLGNIKLKKPDTKEAKHILYDSPNTSQIHKKLFNKNENHHFQVEEKGDYKSGYQAQ